jgi:hypothetical protein
MSFGKRQPESVGQTGERRTSERHRTSFIGRIITDSGQVAECSVVNVSASGAMLAVASILGIPSELELHGFVGGPRRVKVVRRGTLAVAVKFL